MTDSIYSGKPAFYVTLSGAAAIIAFAAAFFYLGFPGGTNRAAYAVSADVVFAGDSESPTALAETPSKTRREWFAAPDGKPTAEGTLKSPWNLTTALAGGTADGRVKPGDVIWLRGGVYAGAFTSRVRGTPDLPVQVRAVAGERAVLDKNSAAREVGALAVRGANVWFRDFEITNSYAERGRLDPDGALNPWRGSAINVWAADTKYINLVIHDSGHGFGLWNEDGGTEIYGCVMFNNGNNKKEHGVYAHNKTGTQFIHDNIIFNGAGYGLHVYANSVKSSISGFDIKGNAIFNNGALMLEDQAADQILVGGVKGVPAERITLRENYIYTEPDAATSKNRGVRLGYEDEENKDVRLYDNYIAGKVPLKILWWNSVEARGNTIYSHVTSVEINTPAGKDASAYQWESNIYLSGKDKDSVFRINEYKTGFEHWRRKNNFDRNGRAERMPASGSANAKVFIRPNKYESGRANVIVYNWSSAERVLINLNDILRAGEKYEVRDAQNYFGEPVLTGVYDGKPIQLPMNLNKITDPIGNVERIPAHTSSEFGVFIIWKK